MTVLERMVVVVGIVTLSAIPVWAGGGQGDGGTEIGGAFQCYLINGENQPHVVNTEDASTPEDQGGTSIKFPPRQNVKLGAGRLVCAPVVVTLAEGSAPLDSIETYPFAEHLKCYDAFDPRLVLVRGPRVTTWDPLDVEDLRVGAPVFICIPAAVTPFTPRP
jgi:hypothetical protein